MITTLRVSMSDVIYGWTIKIVWIELDVVLLGYVYFDLRQFISIIKSNNIGQYAMFDTISFWRFMDLSHYNDPTDTAMNVNNNEMK